MQRMRTPSRQRAIYEDMHFFEDPEFPAQVALNGIDIDRDYYWMPASCYLSDKISSWSPNDHSRIPVFDENQSSYMNQGQLGDCWLIAAFASFAKYPEKIRSLFEVATKDGRYTICLYEPGGKLRRITIDEFIPVRQISPGQYEPYFCTSTEEIWPLLLEKAMAKLAGSYAVLKGNALGHAFMCLTGQKASLFENIGNGIWNYYVYRYAEGAWRPNKQCRRPLDMRNCFSSFFLAMYLSRCSQAQCMMTAMTSRVEDEPKVCQVGLVPSHVYSIIEVRIVEVPGSPSREIGMIRLRNPYGRIRWKGDWSDDCPLWRRHPSVAKALGFMPVPAEESHFASGKFWMAFDDFANYFCRLDVSLAFEDDPDHLRYFAKPVKVKNDHKTPREHSEKRSSATPSPPQVPANKQDVQRCPGGHALQQFRTKNDTFSCDLCHKSVPMGIEMLSCRCCNYDLCEVCGQKMDGNSQTIAKLAKSATPRGSTSPRRDLPPSPPANKHDVERRSPLTPRRPPSPRRDLPPSPPANKQDVQRCPGGHFLQQFRTKNDTFSCDLCHKSVPMGTDMLSCRCCNYDLCEACSQKRDLLPPSVPGNTREAERRRSATPRASPSVEWTFYDEYGNKCGKQNLGIVEENRGRSSKPAKKSLFKSIADVVRGLTPPRGFRNRTPPPGGRRFGL